MVMKKYLSLLMCILASFTVSGCWSREEPKNLAVANSVVYDVREDGQYEVTLEFMNPHGSGGTGPGSSGSAGGARPGITATSTGKSVNEALLNVGLTTDRTLFGGHNEARFFTERFARKDMVSVMDFFARDYLTDLTPYIVIIQGDVDPGTFFTTSPGLAETVGNFINGLEVYQPKEISKSVFITTLDFIKEMYEDGKQPVAGAIRVVECEPSAAGYSSSSSQGGSQGGSQKQYKLVYEGLAAFKENALVGFMDGIEARAYNFITGKIQSAIVSVPTGEDRTVFQVRGAKTRNKLTLEGNQLTIDVLVQMTVTITTEGSMVDITKPDGIKTVQQGLNEMIAQEIASAIGKAQTEFQSDIFGFGTSMHIQHPKLWKSIKDNWDDYFSKATVRVGVSSTIDRTGLIKEPLKMEESK
jgi:spore germination protein KC